MVVSVEYRKRFILASTLTYISTTVGKETIVTLITEFESGKCHTIVHLNFLIPVYVYHLILIRFICLTCISDINVRDLCKNSWYYCQHYKILYWFIIHWFIRHYIGFLCSCIYILITVDICGISTCFNDYKTLMSVLPNLRFLAGDSRHF